MDLQKHYTEASVKTASNLKTIARSPEVREISSLSLPEIDAVAELVARIVPAGNVPGVILNGLLRLAGRKPPLKVVRRDVDLLFKGVEQALDRLVYATFFAGPAAVIWGYQNLLKLAGKDPDDAFPQGTWQFYADYALREDTARHSNQTHGFDTTLRQHEIQLAPADRITAWAMAAIHCLHQYDALLENEWRERVYAHLLQEIVAGEPDAGRYADLDRRWQALRPYTRGADVAPIDDYPTYRRKKFDRFLAEAMSSLEKSRRREWRERVEAAEKQDLPAYCRQMSIVAYLEPGPYGETRRPIPLHQARVGLIYRDRYYLLDACAGDSDRPPDVAAIRAQVSAMLARSPSAAPAQMIPLARTRRAALPRLRARLSPELQQELQALRLAPIWINCGPRMSPPPGPLALSELRQAERGVGDHPLTILDGSETFVFDQSHIFFDGIWGAALAEILTNEALSWAAYLRTLPPPTPGEQAPRGLALSLQAGEQALIQEAPKVVDEVGVETSAVDLRAIQSLRRLFRQRSDLIELTVNDLLVLYRAVHAATYEPDPELLLDLKILGDDSAFHQAALASLEAIESARRINPAMLIPVDASPRFPRQRIHPITLQVPLAELDILNLHEQVVQALEEYQHAGGDRAALYDRFDRLQRAYLATVAGFGQVMSRAKEIAAGGQSASVGSIKLLAHLPAALQHMLDSLPGHFDILNDLIKGREVLSNIGSVALDSSLSRFMTAKDDNEKKTLAWGIVTDARGTMHITLRDFRPHVGSLVSCGRRDLAVRIAQDYLDTYARGLNDFVRDLERITRASRETHSRQLEAR